MESCPTWIGKHLREAQPDAQYGPHNQSYVSLCEKFWGTFQKPPTEALVVGSPCALKTWRVPLESNDRRILSGHTLSRQDAGCSTYPHFTEGEAGVWAPA